jgi:hypothetical protein
VTSGFELGNIWATSLRSLTSPASFGSASQRAKAVGHTLREKQLLQSLFLIA